LLEVEDGFSGVGQVILCSVVFTVDVLDGDPVVLVLELGGPHELATAGFYKQDLVLHHHQLIYTFLEVALAVDDLVVAVLVILVALHYADVVGDTFRDVQKFPPLLFDDFLYIVHGTTLGHIDFVDIKEGFIE
jgi:hypothetical protein